MDGYSPNYNMYGDLSDHAEYVGRRYMEARRYSSGPCYQPSELSAYGTAMSGGEFFTRGFAAPLRRSTACEYPSDHPAFPSRARSPMPPPAYYPYDDDYSYTPPPTKSIRHVPIHGDYNVQNGGAGYSPQVQGGITADGGTVNMGPNLKRGGINGSTNYNQYGEGQMIQDAANSTFSNKGNINKH